MLVKLLSTVPSKHTLPSFHNTLQKLIKFSVILYNLFEVGERSLIWRTLTSVGQLHKCRASQ